MSETRCATCGESGCRIDAPLIVGEITIGDAYCGVCGVNWGRYVEAIAEQRRRTGKKPRKVQREQHRSV